MDARDSPQDQTSVGLLGEVLKNGALPPFDFSCAVAKALLLIHSLLPWADYAQPLTGTGISRQFCFVSQQTLFRALLVDFYC